MKNYELVEPRTGIVVGVNGEKKYGKLYVEWYDRIDMLKEKEYAKSDGTELYHVVNRRGGRIACANFPIIRY